MNEILLIQMPFFTAHTPSISIELLKSELNRNGFNCNIEYYNFEFAQIIGLDLYTLISEHLPQELLLGDIIFSPILYDKPITSEYIKKLVLKLSGSGSARKVPKHLINSVPYISNVAREFISDKLEQTNWSNYTIVGFSTIFNTIPSLALAQGIKKSFNTTPVVFGGSSCEAEMGEYLHRCFPFVDFVCRGEGEHLIVDLVKHLTGDNVELQDIKGLIWRKENKTIINGKRTNIIKNLDDVPVPTYEEWIERIKNADMLNEKRLRLPMETSRGCWYGAKKQCRFCGLNGVAISYRSKSPKRALFEFQELINNYDIKAINTVDNILDPKYFKTVIPYLSKINHDVSIFYEIKSNLTYKQLLNLRSAGVTRIQPGIESLNTETLSLMRKGVTALQNIRLIKWASELGIIVAWNILYGFPDEKKKHYYSIIELIPKISHLQPPIICTPMRLDRFSPFYNNTELFGLKKVRPFPSYAEIYPFDHKSIFNLAYFFEHKYASHADLQKWVKDLNDSVESWKVGAGISSFTCIDRNNTLYIFDSRPIALNPVSILNGIERELYNACQDGRSLKSLSSLLKYSPIKLSSILNKFIENNWMVKVDKKFLALTVRMNEHIPDSIPLSILEPVTQNVYCSFLKGHYDSLVDTIDSKVFYDNNYQLDSKTIPYNKANSADAKNRAAD